MPQSSKEHEFKTKEHPLFDRLWTTVESALNKNPTGQRVLETWTWIGDIFRYNIQYSSVGLGRNVFVGYMLGFVAGSSFWMMFLFPHAWRFFASICSFCVFHLMEFLMTAVGQPQSVSFTSFLLDHSNEFAMARNAAFFEFWVELILFPDMKTGSTLFWLSLICFVVSFGGQVIRSLAMFTAGKSFTHLVAHRKSEEHVLIDWGIYKYIRHPSYLGWYVWAVFMQLGMLNPVCTVLYILVIYRFFASRIPDEEAALLKFFGDAYADYCKKTPSYLPFMDQL